MSPTTVTPVSWDLVIQNLPSGIRSVAEIPDEFEPVPLDLDRVELIETIRGVFPSVNADDPTWLVANDRSWSIEFNLGATDPIPSFALHVRSTQPPLGEIGRFLGRLGLQAIDPQADSGLCDAEAAAASAKDV